MHNNSKIKPSHLERKACIYIRQSSPSQVIKHTGSTTRQYNLVDRALELGWGKNQIVIIDEDQATSATSTYGRNAYKNMLSEIIKGNVGAVISIDASARLSREGSDWHLLLNICETSDTLIIDETHIYDMSDPNDRFSLGIKGLFSQAETHTNKDRFTKAKQAKAELGQLRILLPPGLIYDTSGKIILDPDEGVQKTIKMVFELFDQLGSAGKVLEYFSHNNLKFPKRLRTKDQHDLEWVTPRNNSILRVLHNPMYAGAYAYGRYQRQKYINEGDFSTRYRQVERKREDWPVLIGNNHQGYISWELFLLNEKKLSDNKFIHDGSSRGAARVGVALLQGIIICGKCGSRMKPYYKTRRNASYECLSNHNDFGMARCQSIVHTIVDDAVMKELLKAIVPTQLELSIADFSLIGDRRNEIERQVEARRRQAQHEEILAKQRFMKADPDNDLVYPRLQREWNERLKDINDLENELIALLDKSPRPLTRSDQQSILSLAQDVPKLWNADETTNEERKQLLRYLIKVVTITKTASDLHVGIQWQTNIFTETTVKLSAMKNLLRTDKAVLDKITELTANHSDKEIAEILNKEGIRSKNDKVFSKNIIQYLRHQYLITTTCPDHAKYLKEQPRGDGRYTAAAVANMLGVTKSTISVWCNKGRLDAIRLNSRGTWWIKIIPKQIPKMKKMIKQREVKVGENRITSKVVRRRSDLLL